MPPNTYLERRGSKVIADFKKNPAKEEAKTLTEIQPSMGKLITLDKEKVGAYRDKADTCTFYQPSVPT